MSGKKQPFKFQARTLKRWCDQFTNNNDYELEENQGKLVWM